MRYAKSQQIDRSVWKEDYLKVLDAPKGTCKVHQTVLLVFLFAISICVCSFLVVGLSHSFAFCLFFFSLFTQFLTKIFLQFFLLTLSLSLSVYNVHVVKSTENCSIKLICKWIYQRPWHTIAQWKKSEEVVWFWWWLWRVKCNAIELRV